MERLVVMNRVESSASISTLPRIGTPNSSDWPGYHTHWTPPPPIPFGVQVAHTDHPLRHYDRTCPACNPDGVNGGGNG